MTTQREPGVEQNMRERMTFYAAGLGACVMGLAALRGIVSQGGFVSIAFVLLAGGFCLSWAARAGLIARTKLDAGMLVVLLCTLAAVLIFPEFRNRLLPPEVLNATDLTMAVVLAWLMVACSYGLTSDVRVLFLCVPSLSLIGLTATFDPTVEVMSYFAVFLTLGCFILIRENVFVHREATQTADGSLRLSSGSMKMHIGVTASVTLTALVIGIALGTLLYPRLVRMLSTQVSPLDVGQGEDQLGSEEFVPVATGPVDLSNLEVMTVRCKESLLWRGRTFGRYTGRGWANDLAPEEEIQIFPSEQDTRSSKPRHSHTFRIPTRALPKARSAIKRVEQKFTITNGFYQTVYAAPEPETIAFNMHDQLLTLGNRIEAAVTFTRHSSYTVTSQVSTATPNQLSRAPSVYSKAMRQRYLAVPETCWQVQKLARRIAGRGADPYAKAAAIQSFLEDNYSYDAKAPAAPDEQDAVTHFLFKSKRGYCDIFASAMVVMARQVGIPARWVTGFASGDYESADSLYHVLAKHRHAWAELYFPGYGWIAFDPAPA
ncbi:MAG: transglutaminaseTgpA domain-containing protein, partial [Armatimonadetes bacterium]|nr:transglutaminaseTgpA domain-containing protein [Armatimonadota bacterium]